jgi:hypothetical protein
MEWAEPVTPLGQGINIFSVSAENPEKRTQRREELKVRNSYYIQDAAKGSSEHENGTSGK